MQRRTILILAACLAICAGIAPLVAIAYLSQTRATQAEQQHLAEYAQWTLKRANITLTEAEDALRQLKGAHGCTPAHIVRMRRLTIDARSVDEIGHYQGGRLTCTSWGQVQAVVPESAPPMSGWSMGWASICTSNPGSPEGAKCWCLVTGRIMY